MDFKYKIADVAKEFGVPAKKVIETVAPITGETYKTGGTFGERELDFLLEKLTRLPGQRRESRGKEAGTQKGGAQETGSEERTPARQPQARETGGKAQREARYAAGTGGEYRHQEAGGRHGAGAGQPRAGVSGHPHGGRQRG